ncbi:MAG TPA: hypothetical protein VIU33_08020 [Nitrospiria bacterium]
MKDFSKKGFQISKSPTEVKLAYTGFLIFAFLGYFTIALLGFLRVGPGPQAIVEHYRGSDNEDKFERPVGQMLEEAHFHAFIEGVVLLILTHLIVATSLSRNMKVTVILLAYGFTLVDLASPWLVKYVSGGFAYLQMTAWFAMLGTAIVMIGVPINEMWFSGAKDKKV